MSTLTSMSTAKLINEYIRLDKRIKDDKKQSDCYKAELQNRAITLMNDKSIKYVKFYGDNSTASVTDSLKLEILNMDRLKLLFGEGVIKEQVTEITRLDYKWKTKFERLLKIIFTGEYTFEYDLDEFLDAMDPKPDNKQKRLLLKNLKGDYERDRDTLLTVFGYIAQGDAADKAEPAAPDYDVELYYVNKIKNAELIKAFLPEEGLDASLREIRQCIMVDASTAIKIDYDKEEKEEETA